MRMCARGLPKQDFHFGVPDARNYISSLRSCRFFHFFILAALTVHEGAGSALLRHSKTRKRLGLKRFFGQLYLSPMSTYLLAIRRSLSNRQRQRVDPPHHGRKQPPFQMALWQQQPVIPGVLDQTTVSVHQPLPQTGQRPLLDPVR